MPRRTHQRERRRALRERVLDAETHGPGGEPRELFGFGRGERIGVEHHRAAGGRFHRRDVLRAVHRQQLVARRRARFDDRPALLAPGGGHGVEHVRALHALDVTGRCQVIAKALGRNQQQRHAAKSSRASSRGS